MGGTCLEEARERSREARPIGSVLGPELFGITPLIDSDSGSPGREPSLSVASGMNSASSAAGPRSVSGTTRAISAVSITPCHPSAFGIHVSGRSTATP